MKELKEILEGVFDRDLVQKDPIDLSWFKIKNPNERYDLFLQLNSIMNTPEIENLPEWMGENYYEHQAGFDFILESLYDAFRKQHYTSWFDITTSDFEEIGDEMTEVEINDANSWLEWYFSKANITDMGGRFLNFKGKLPDFLVNLIKDTNNWDNKLSNITNWALDYYNDYDQVLSVYGCPKGLNSTVKKLLYD